MMAGIPEGGFTGGKQLEAWLNGLPEDTRVPFAGVIAHRAAMRALPFGTGDKSSPLFTNISPKDLIALFYALSASIVALKSPIISNIAAVGNAGHSVENISKSISHDQIRNILLTISYSAHIIGYLKSQEYLMHSVLSYSENMFINYPRYYNLFEQPAAMLNINNSSQADYYSTNNIISNGISRSRALLQDVLGAGDSRISDAAGAAMWEGLTADARALDASGETPTLASPIWPGGAPDFWQGFDRDFRRVLTEQKIWTVWLEWWQSRVDGAPSWGLPPALEQEVETRIALGDGRKDFWDRNPAVVNGEIAGWVTEARKKAKPDKSLGQFVVAALTERKRQMSVAEIRAAFDAANYHYLEQSLRSILSYYTERGLIERVSKGVYALPKTTESDEPQEADFAQRPASLRALWINGKLENDRKLVANLPPEQVFGLFQALKKDLNGLARKAGNAATNSVREDAVKLLRETAALIAKDGPDFQALCRLAIKDEVLLGYLPTVETEWPNLLAAEFRAISLQLGKALDQADAIKAFKRNAIEAELEKAADDTIPTAVHGLSNELKKLENKPFVGKSVTDALDASADLASLPSSSGDDQRTMPIRASYDALESSNNLLKELVIKAQAEGLVSAAQAEYEKAFAKNYMEAANKAGKEDAEIAAKLAGRALLGRKAIQLIGHDLAQRYPRMFGWFAKAVPEHDGPEIDLDANPKDDKK